LRHGDARLLPSSFRQGPIACAAARISEYQHRCKRYDPSWPTRAKKHCRHRRASTAGLLNSDSGRNSKLDQCNALQYSRIVLSRLRAAQNRFRQPIDACCAYWLRQTFYGLLKRHRHRFDDLRLESGVRKVLHEPPPPRALPSNKNAGFRSSFHSVGRRRFAVAGAPVRLLQGPVAACGGQGFRRQNWNVRTLPILEVKHRTSEKTPCLFNW